MLRNCFVVLYILRKGLSTMKKIRMKFLSVLWTGTEKYQWVIRRANNRCTNSGSVVV